MVSGGSDKTRRFRGGGVAGDATGHPDGNVPPGRRIPGAVPGRWLLAWLAGRDAGTALTVSAGPAGAGQEPAGGRGSLPPKLPKWS